MGLTQEHYELYTFLTDCVYSELAYPSQIGFNERVVKTSGLRLEIFELIDRKIIIICGTNSLKDWLANIKVGLGFTPHQHKQALKIASNYDEQVIDVDKENEDKVDLSKVDTGTRIIKNDKVSSDDDEKMEFM